MVMTASPLRGVLVRDAVGKVHRGRRAVQRHDARRRPPIQRRHHLQVLQLLLRFFALSYSCNLNLNRLFSLTHYTYKYKANNNNEATHLTAVSL